MRCGEPFSCMRVGPATLSSSLSQRVIHWLTVALVLLSVWRPNGMIEWYGNITRIGAACADPWKGHVSCVQ